VHPNLRGHTKLRFTRLATLSPCDVLFVALPHGEVMGRIDQFAAVAERIVDLSADFRLRDPAGYSSWYGREHPSPEWLSRFVYGLPELHRHELQGAKFTSGVGCNAAVTILGLWPLYKRGLVREAVIDVKVGSSEGGAKATSASHHPERAGVVRTFAPVRHRHIAELIQELELDPDEPNLHFSVTSVELVRGALATSHCLLNEDIESREAWRIFREDYCDEPFIRLVTANRGIHRYPEPKTLAGSNHCDIGFASDSGNRRLVVVSAIDNLMKGASGTAVQCMNLMCGLPETEGLEFPGLHPV
jgi:N-acetyl-gamma-glutamyl-phosphate/LysW-gamma-L-alpha-aminoadipyl-6-phosphate reductase